jgi:hypothetical protein
MVPSKRNKHKNLLFFVAILKGTDEKCRIWSWNRIRIRESKVWRSASGSVPKCHGSGTLVDTDPKQNIHPYIRTSVTQPFSDRFLFTASGAKGRRCCLMFSDTVVKGRRCCSMSSCWRVVAPRCRPTLSSAAPAPDRTPAPSSPGSQADPPSLPSRLVPPPSALHVSPPFKQCCVSMKF